VHPLLRAAAEKQLGLFTARDAYRAGYGEPEVRHLCRSGAWTRIRRGVYMTNEGAAAIEGRPSHRHRIDSLALLLSLDRPDAALSHSTAARIFDLPVRRDLEHRIRLTDPTGQWRRGTDFLVTHAPLTAEQVMRRGPLRLTVPVRTLVDCAREWPLEDTVVAMDAALLLALTTPAELQHQAASITHWRGAARAARAVELADGRSESPLETRGRLRIVGAGLPTPELQVEIRVGGRLVAVVDAWFEESAVAVEFDGRVKYTDPWRGRDPAQVLWEEKRREDDLRALDIRVVRITDDDVERRWPHVEGKLRELMTWPGPVRRGFTATPRERGRRRAG
jgi:hypothetical protein